MIPYKIVKRFSEENNCRLNFVENGQHWLHTDREVAAMALCGLPVKKVWEKVREFLAKYTDELPDTDELDGDSTTGNVEEHRTQER